MLRNETLVYKEMALTCYVYSFFLPMLFVTCKLW